IKENPDAFIICFSSNDVINFLDISALGGIYIYSSPGAFKTEQEFDFIRLNRWLKSYGIKPYGFRIEKTNGTERPIFTRGFHASGHASENELEWIIDKINPKMIIPVHTENLDWFKERYRDKAKILRKGEKLIL
ncbi:MAG: MBL fold metallo-hydrolase RNA specificity domain-containing protein, partial [Candidatus Hodarchaeota archaeon]